MKKLNAMKAEIESITGKTVTDIVPEKKQHVFWGEDGVLAILNDRTGKLTIVKF